MKKLQKSRTDQMIAGVCGGIAERFNIDSTLVRLLFVLFTLTGGSGILLYIILAVIVPDGESRTYQDTDRVSPSGRPMHDAKQADDEDWSDF